MIVIDVFAKVRGQKKREEEPYQYDYRMLSGLQRLALTYHVAIVVVHHTRKASAPDDILDSISGTTGIAGAADAAMVLGRSKGVVRLYIRGRDVEETDKTVLFNSERGTWSIAGDFDTSEWRLEAKIYQCLVRARVPLTPKQVADQLMEKPGSVRVVMTRMRDNGDIERVEGGYRPTTA
jgi:hypothetical protein